MRLSRVAMGLIVALTAVSMSAAAASAAGVGKTITLDPTAAALGLTR